MAFQIGRTYRITWHAEGASLNVPHDGSFEGECTRSDGWVTLKKRNGQVTRLDIPEGMITGAEEVTS